MALSSGVRVVLVVVLVVVLGSRRLSPMHFEDDNEDESVLTAAKQP